MTGIQLEIQLIAAVVAVACALPGAYLILRHMAMMSDAISHAILFGIVIAFFATGDISSPVLIAAAALTGLLTVSLVELIHRTRLVKEDAAIGLVFPLLFSIGVILISHHAGRVHLDTDAVLLGELAFAPFNRLVVTGMDLGPKALYVMGGILLLNVCFIALFYKELKLATFDPALAAALGFAPTVIHYMLMGLVSLTAVGAFDAVGSILVVALMIGPPATAYLLTYRLSHMLLLSALSGTLSAVSGYWVAHGLDVSIAGSMACMVGVQFLLVWMLAPDRGLIARARRRRSQRRELAETMVLVHLYHHEARPEATLENKLDQLHVHLNWEKTFTRQVVQRALKHRLLELNQGQLQLTLQGREMARRALQR